MAPALAALATAALVLLFLLPVLPASNRADPLQRLTRAVVSEHSRAVMWGARSSTIMPTGSSWLTQESGIALARVFAGDDTLWLVNAEPVYLERERGVALHYRDRAGHFLTYVALPAPALKLPERARVSVGNLAAGPPPGRRLRHVGVEARRSRLLPRLRHGERRRDGALQGILRPRAHRHRAPPRLLKSGGATALPPMAPHRFEGEDCAGRARARTRCVQDVCPIVHTSEPDWPPTIPPARRPTLSPWRPFPRGRVSERNELAAWASEAGAPGAEEELMRRGRSERSPRRRPNSGGGCRGERRFAPPDVNRHWGCGNRARGSGSRSARQRRATSARCSRGRTRSASRATCCPASR